MKKTGIIFIILIFAFNSCRFIKCPPSCVEPKDIDFYFSIIDKDGNDLFFGEKSLYNPNNVKLITEQGDNIFQEWFQVLENKKCFLLGGFYATGKPYIFPLIFFENKIDTIRIESIYIGNYEEPKGCVQFSIYENDIYFNNFLICKNFSDDNIYKIKIK